MSPQTLQLLLVLGVFAFYLHDSALLLHYDEIVLTRRGRRWFASAGSQTRLAGRYLYLPDPLRPAAPLFRGGWLDTGQPAEHWAGFDHYLVALTRFAAPCRLLWWLLLVMLPLMLWRAAHPMAMLALAGAIYASVLWIGLRLWRLRRVLELSGRQALGLAFELLCCPPHAINTVRRLCERRGLRGEAMAAARRLLGAGHTATLAGEIGERLNLALDFRGDDPSLLDARRRLERLR